MAPKVKRPTSSSDFETTYDVFLSFRGPDTRMGFTSILYDTLTNAGIRVFRGVNEQIHMGMEVSNEIRRAIDQSRVCVPIFSKNYASSKWCLTELVMMIESMREASGSNKKKILPILYGVSVDDLMLKTELYTGALMMKHQETGKFRTVLEWASALRDAGKIKGYELKDQGYAEFSKSFVREISLNLEVKHTLVPDYLVQRDDEVEALIKLLDIDSPGVRFVGIHGMGGIGKTTLAKVVFNKLCHRFDHICFLADVRESSRHLKGIEKLQDQLLESSGQKFRKILDKDDGIMMIREILREKELLLVLDDVVHDEQMQYLAGDASWFGSGSRIIITSRDNRVFRDDVQIFELEIMKPEEALRLFTMHAFGQDSPPNDYLSLSEEIVARTGRLPLALEVIGLHLRNKRRRVWEKVINGLKKAPHGDVMEKLRISYEALEDGAKQIFLDIACFFIGHDKTYPMYIWEACQFNPEVGLEELIHMSLVKVKHQKLWMHDLLRDMGRNIARRNRIWRQDEALKVLQAKEGNDEIQAIYWENYKQASIHLNPKAFEKMPRLRLLILRGCDFLCGPSSLPNELRWLEWEKYPSTSLPPDFIPRNLGGLILSESRITTLWDEQKMCPNITLIDLSECGGLLEVPDVSGMPNLKKLRVDMCSNLITVDESVGSLEKLEYLSFSKCGSLQKLPTKLKLPALQYLGLRECKKLEKFPDVLGTMEHIEILDLSETSIKTLPPSIRNLVGLKTLRLSLVKSLEALPRCIYHLPNLKELDLDDCDSLDGFMEKEEEDVESRSLPCSTSFFPNLVELNLQNYNQTSLSPCISECYNLKTLNLSSSRQLKEIPELPPRLEFLDASFCISLETVQTHSLQLMEKIRIDLTNCDKLTGKEEMGRVMLSKWLKGHEKRMRTSYSEVDLNDDHFEAIIPGSDIPDRLYHGRSNAGKNRLRFRVHSQSRVLNELAGFALFAAFSMGHNFRWRCKWLMNINEERVYAQEISYIESGHVWIVYIHLKKHRKEEMMKLLVDGWNHLSFEIEFPDDLFSSRVRGFKRSLKSSAVAFIGRSGEDLNPSTEIEFLSPEVAKADEPEEWRPMMYPTKAIVEDEDTISAASIIPGVVSNNAQAAGGSSSISQPLPQEMPPLHKRQWEFPSGLLSLNTQPFQDEQSTKKMKRSNTSFIADEDCEVIEEAITDDELPKEDRLDNIGQATEDMEMDTEASRTAILDKLSGSRGDVPVGMQDREKKLMQLLDVKSQGVVVASIYGMGGLGKTSLAKLVFDQLRAHFEGCSFLNDIRETSKRKGLKYLEDKLIRDIEGADTDLDTGIKRPDFLKKRVLIVLDDVDDREQIKKLVGMYNRFVSASRIIITTRDISVLAIEHETVHGRILERPEGIQEFKMEEMNSDDALQLFCSHAFGEVHPRDGYKSLCEQVVSTIGGHPLALEIIGSFLNGKPEHEWAETLKKLGKSDRDLQKILRISYEALELETKEVFLDIACFFTGSQKYAPMYMWDACELLPEQRIKVLIFRSFIKVLDDKFWMHDEVRDFGREIACGGTTTDSAEGRRFWVNTDALNILWSRKENKNVRGLRLCHDDFLPSSTLPPRKLGSLPSLRFLELSRFPSAVKHDLAEFFSWRRMPELRWLSLHHCPQHVKATTVCLEKLVILDLSNSEIDDQWFQTCKLRVAKTLKILNLTSCKKITRTPVFSEEMTLERLILEDCEKLAEIDPSIGELKHLIYLNLKGCHSLEKVPNELSEAKDLTELAIEGNGQSFRLQNSIVSLTSLSVLEIGKVKITGALKIGNWERLVQLRLCECAGIKKLPRSIHALASLVRLDLSGSDFDQLPDSVGEMTNLKVVNIESSQIKEFPKSIWKLEKLEELRAKRCRNLQGEIPNEIMGLSSLSILDLSFTRISSLPSTLNQLVKLRTLNLESCHELVGLPKLPKTLVSLHVISEKLQIFPDLLEMNTLADLQLVCPVDNFQAAWIEKLPGLEKLELFVPNLTTLGFNEASQLRYLSLSCRNMGRLPLLPSTLSRLCLAYLEESTKFTDLCKLERLTFLDFYRCSLDRGQCISLGTELKSLERLSATKCQIGSINETLHFPEGLRVLSMKECELPGKVINLSRVKNLLQLELIDCHQLIEIRGLGELESLEQASICNCNSLERMGDLSNLKSLESLQINNCLKLEDVTGLDRIKSLKCLEIYGCSSMNSSPSNA